MKFFMGFAFLVIALVALYIGDKTGFWGAMIISQVWWSHD